MTQTPEQRRRVARDKRLRDQYNISADEWDLIFKHQGRRCPVCTRSEARGGKPLLWNTDHDHSDGLVRGILCVHCNRQLKEFWTLTTVGNVFNYLKYPPATTALGELRFGRKGRVTKRKRTRRRKKT